MGPGPQAGTLVGGWNLEHWQNLTALVVGHITIYARSTPTQISRWTGRSSQPWHHHRGFLPVASLIDTLHCRCSLYLPRSDDIHGGNFHLQIPFRGGLPLNPAGCPVPLSPAVGSSMVKHLMECERPLQAQQPPTWVLIKEYIGIQLPLHLSY